MKPSELRTKDGAELEKELEGLLRAQFGLRMQVATQQLGKDRKSTRLNSSHIQKSRMPSSASCCSPPGRPACAGFSPRRVLAPSPLRSFRRLLSHDCAYPCDVAFHFLQLAGVAQLLSRHLHAQAELRPQQAFQLLFQLSAVLGA